MSDTKKTPGPFRLRIPLPVSHPDLYTIYAKPLGPAGPIWIGEVTRDELRDIIEAINNSSVSEN